MRLPNLISTYQAHAKNEVKVKLHFAKKKKFNITSLIKNFMKAYGNIDNYEH